MALARVHTWSAGEILLASDLNAEFNNVLTNANSLITPFTANVSGGGFQLNNIIIGASTPLAGSFTTVTASSTGVAATSVPNLGQIQASGTTVLGSVAGTNTITGTLTPTLTAYASGQVFTLIPANATTAAATLNIDGLGAKNIFSGGVAFVGGELRAGVPVSVEYDGTQFNVLGHSARNAAWTPTDASGAGLSLTLGDCTLTRIGNMVWAMFDITYPATADGSNALIGGLTFTSANTANNSYANGISANQGTAAVAIVVKNSTTFGINKATDGTNFTNANLTGKVLRGIAIYRAAS